MAVDLGDPEVRRHVEQVAQARGVDREDARTRGIVECEHAVEVVFADVADRQSHRSLPGAVVERPRIIAPLVIGERLNAATAPHWVWRASCRSRRNDLRRMLHCRKDIHCGHHARPAAQSGRPAALRRPADLHLRRPAVAGRIVRAGADRRPRRPSRLGAVLPRLRPVLRPGQPRPGIAHRPPPQRVDGDGDDRVGDRHRLLQPQRAVGRAADGDERRAAVAAVMARVAGLADRLLGLAGAGVRPARGRLLAG